MHTWYGRKLHVQSDLYFLRKHEGFILKACTKFNSLHTSISLVLSAAYIQYYSTAHLWSVGEPGRGYGGGDANPTSPCLDDPLPLLRVIETVAVIF